MLKAFFKFLYSFCVWTLALVLVAGIALVIYYYSQIRYSVDDVVYYNPPLTTQIYDRKGRLIANLFDKEHRHYARIDDIPSRMIEALAAIEDTLFFEHNGINLDAIIRAMSKNIREGRIVEGASTLTQQLVKNVLLTREKTFDRKIKEALLALRLETILSKEEIIERYLNEAFFGHGYYGVRTAARGYFRKDLDELSLKEIAILVGIPRAPTLYNPTRNPELIFGRANNVLIRMKTLGWIDEYEFKRAIDEIPAIYDDTLTQNRAPYVVDMVIKELQGKVPDLKSGGYEITLNLDLEYQNIARDALVYGYRQIKERNKDENLTRNLNGAMVVMESNTGNLLALLGGVDYAKSSFNRAVMSRRQPGSAFKPFIYQTALDRGYSTISRIADISRTYKFEEADENTLGKTAAELAEAVETNETNENDQYWQPQNYGKNFEGLTTLQDAVIKSMNLATINLVNDLGFDNVHKSVKSYGFGELPYNLSIALGSFGISPLQMSEMYTMFSNYGNRIKPILIKGIRNRLGQYLSFDSETVRITPDEQAYLMVDTLRKVVVEGTGRRAAVKGIQLAGKTGTTNDNVDAWFCGFSPTIQTVVWYGNDDNTPMGKYETGGRAPTPAFQYFYAELLKRHPELRRTFRKPEGVRSSRIDGKEVLFTERSRLPKETPIQEEELIF